MSNVDEENKNIDLKLPFLTFSDEKIYTKKLITREAMSLFFSSHIKYGYVPLFIDLKNLAA